MKIDGTRSIDFTIPKFLTLSEHPNAKACAHAIACLSYFAPINGHLNQFIATLLLRASDDDSAVRRHVCESFALLLALKLEKLTPEMDNVAE